ncbi:MAG TPA: hypothetical protein VE977_09085, partial [Pyrinomonadaceae bacterium]|nr:hypothetical protein [Pyrinomonadaceae bacterium]
MKNCRRSNALNATMLMSVVLLIVVGEQLMSVHAAQDTKLTPIQVAIEKQRQRLSSAEIEDRREALMQLRALQRPEASRVALSALND